MRKLLLLLFLFTLTSTAVAEEDILDTFNKKFGVSRIEYSVNRIIPELEKKLQNRSAKEDEIGCNGRVQKIPRTKYKDESEDKLLFRCYYNILLSNVFDRDYPDEKILENIEMYDIESLSDSIIKDIFMHFAHFGDYTRINYYGENIVHRQLLKLFSNTLQEVKRAHINESDFKLAEQLSDKIYFIFQLKIDGSKFMKTKSYIYPLNQIWRNADGEVNFDKALLGEYYYPDESAFD